jgi:hypothetical protein
MVTVTQNPCPVLTCPGSTTTLATSFAAVCTVADTLAPAVSAVPPHVVPVAVALHVANPLPDPENVHTNVVDDPAASVTGPGGVAPAIHAARPAGFAYAVALTPLTVACPVFVTVSHTVSHCPTDA